MIKRKLSFRFKPESFHGLINQSGEENQQTNQKGQNRDPIVTKVAREKNVDAGGDSERERERERDEPKAILFLGERKGRPFFPFS